MTGQTILEFYQTLGFEETEQEDGSSALFFELSSEGNYALLTDETGTLPKSLNQPIIFAYYTPEDSFLWSTSFKNSLQFQEVWSSGQTLDEKQTAIVKYRDSTHYYTPSV